MNNTFRNSQVGSKIRATSTADIHKLTSGQVIIDLESAVKELLENSLDAHANNIEIIFKNYGLDYVEVIDNGTGISEDNFTSVAAKYHTSKISNFEDLQSNVTTYGFRGEAMSSLCAIGNVRLVTATKEVAPKATALQFDNAGIIKERKVASRVMGTTVNVSDLFALLPVRRKIFVKNIKKEFTKAVTLIQAYCVICQGVKITVSNISGGGSSSSGNGNSKGKGEGKKKLLFSTNKNGSIKDNIVNIYGAGIRKSLMLVDFVVEVKLKSIQKEINANEDGNDHDYDDGERDNDIDNDDDGERFVEKMDIRFTGFISYHSFGFGRNSTDRQMFFINNRPCALPRFARSINEVYKSYNRVQYPVFFLNALVEPHWLDINITPDKKTINFANEGLVLDELKEQINGLYATLNDILPVGVTQSITDSLKQNTIDRSFKELNSHQRKKIDDEEDEEVSSYKKRKLDQSLSRFSLESQESAGSTKPKKVDVLQIAQEEAFAMGESKENDNTDTEAEDRTIIDETIEGSVSGEVRSSDKQNDPLATVQVISIDQLSQFKNSDNNDSQKEEVSVEHADKKDDLDVENREEYQFRTYQDEERTKDEEEIKEVAEEKNEDKTSRSNLYLGVADSEVETSTRTWDDYESQKLVGNHSNTPDSSSCKCLHHDSITSTEIIVNQDSDNIDKEVELINMLSGLQPTKGKLADNYLTSRKNDSLNYIVTVDNDTRSMMDNFRFIKGNNRWHTGNYAKNGDTEDEDDEDDTNDYNMKNEVSVDDINKPAEEAESQLALKISKTDFLNMKIIGQFNLGFIIVVKQIDGELFIIDQHASDEKYNFEKLSKETVFQSQRLVIPQELQLSSIDRMIVLEHLDIFSKNGFTIISEDKNDNDDDDRSGDDDDNNESSRKLYLKSTPTSKKTVFGISDFNELVTLIKENQGMGKQSMESLKCSKIRLMFAMRACRKSIMVGRPLTHKAMIKVVRNLNGLDKPWNCPHGRPTMRHLAKLDKIKSFNDDYRL